MAQTLLLLRAAAPTPSQGLSLPSQLISVAVKQASLTSADPCVIGNCVTVFFKLLVNLFPLIGRMGSAIKEEKAIIP